MTISIEKLHNGALRLTAMIDGRLVTRVYYGYSRKEARAMFKSEV